MTDRGTERWQQIEQLVDAALDLSTADRQAWLRDACNGDDALVIEVNALMEAGERQDDFLGADAAGRAANLLARRAGDESIRDRIGPFRVMHELGRGGMGTVYLAERDAHFRQRVALKVIRPGLHLNEHLVDRFVEERQVLADLEHPGIARLLDGGVTDDGLPWFAMEYVEGEPIDKACDSRRLSIESRLQLFCSVCDAVEFAHQRRVIHRDIKPNNILVSESGSVKLLDFGIARVLAAEGATTDRSHTGAGGGRFLTPDYASPEQIRGDPASAASDVYSLGVLLHELLTGRRPHRVRGLTSSEAEHVVLERDPDPPSVAVTRTERTNGDSSTDSLAERARARQITGPRLRERLQGELDRIVLQALSRGPATRYASAAALAADVRRHLDGQPVLAPSPTRRTRRRVVMAGILIAAVIAAVSLIPRPHPSSLIFAVGRVVDHRGDSANTLWLTDLLATNLARVPEIRVLSSSRLYELAGTGSAIDRDRGAFAMAARRGGASAIIDGDIYPQAGGRLRFDLRHVDLASGSIVAALSLTGDDLFALVDSGTARLASGLGTAGPSASVADVTTRSEIAYRFYEEGLRAYYRGDVTGARAVFDAAIGQDSAFAMAHYYRSLSTPRADSSVQFLRSALRLADRASDRERLIIRAAWQTVTSDPALLATAETLTVRYPLELTGQQMYARALSDAADYPGAVRRYRQVIDADSLAGVARGPRCTSCDARAGLIWTLVGMDSAPAAVREGQRWTAIDPRSAAAWHALASAYITNGMADSGRAAYLQAAAIDPSLAGTPHYFGVYHMGPGDYETADAALREMLRSGTPAWKTDASWYLAISFRRQGRLDEALRLARQYRDALERDLPEGYGSAAAMEAQVLFERGQFRASALLFDSIARDPFTAYESESRVARYRAWNLAHAATGLAAARDTTALARLVDSVRVVGARSLLARDQRLHHHVRGLLVALRGDDAGAAGEFRQAMFSLGSGFARTNYELAGALLRLNRSRDAIAVLQPVFPMLVEGYGLYVTRTDVEERLARAWDDAGGRDSALAHYRSVVDVLRNADASFAPRVASLRSRIADLEAQKR